MTRYYKQTDSMYILAVGVGVGGIEISADEYSEILSVIQNRPTAEGKGYRLKADLTWISIHAPAWGATPKGDTGAQGPQGISIHAPAWGATTPALWVAVSIEISIHAPAWGATQRRDKKMRR